MKNAQDEGLKPQPTDITASSVVINKSEENSPQIQIPLVNKESTKTQSVIEASQEQENGKPTSSTSIPEISVPVNGEVSKKVSDLSTEDNDNVKSIQAVEVKPIVSQVPQDNLPQVQPPLVNEDTVKAVSAVEVLPKPEDREQPLSQSDREIEPTLDQVVLKEISTLVTEGNDRINHVAENGILLLGKTGSGKSTLAHVLAGRKLQSIFDDEIGEFIIDTLQPIKGIKIIHDKAIVEQPDNSEIRIGHSPLSETTIPNKITIGHNSAFETTIPNKCKVQDALVWDCPGFKDTAGIAQEIANGFYIKKLFQNTKQLKFVLVVSEASFSDKSLDFIDIANQFARMFKDIEVVRGSVALVVTHTSPGKKVEHIENLINRIIAQKSALTEKYTATTEKILKYLTDSLHIFYKPSTEGEISVNYDFFAKINLSTSYTSHLADSINVSISSQSKSYADSLLVTAGSNFKKIVSTIVQAITESERYIEGDDSAFTSFYKEISKLLPQSIEYEPLIRLPEHNKSEHFINLSYTRSLQEVLSSKVDSFDACLVILHNILRVFEEFASSNNKVQLKKYIQEYDYALKQQIDYLKLFSQLCDKEMPEFFEMLKDKIAECKGKIDINFEKAVKSMVLEPDQAISYYQTAIEYLDMYKNDPECIKNKAKAYYHLGLIYDEERDSWQALQYYFKAIELDKELTPVYTKVGDLFFSKGKYEIAIDYYKAVKHDFKIKACIKKLIAQNPENPDIMMMLAEYYSSRELNEKAIKYYQYAQSLTQDEQIKSKALGAIGNILKKDKAKQGDEYIKNAAEHNYFNYANFNQEELLGKYSSLLEELNKNNDIAIIGVDSYLMVPESEYSTH
jgi:tetratricopeptide (TPR) repeat protein/GTPase SAR1 family protein